MFTGPPRTWTSPARRGCRARPAVPGGAWPTPWPTRCVVASVDLCAPAMPSATDGKRSASEVVQRIIGIRDSKAPDAGHLTVSPEHFAGLVASVKCSEHDLTRAAYVLP
nr:DUF397 domain-containing protein [Actinomadura sp. HBU206391]